MGVSMWSAAGEESAGISSLENGLMVLKPNILLDSNFHILGINLSEM